MEGTLDYRVQTRTPLAGPGHGQIDVRVGRVLIYLNDREALSSWLEAWREASVMADKADRDQRRGHLAPRRPGGP